MRSTVPGPDQQASGYQLKIELVARLLVWAGAGWGVCPSPRRRHTREAGLRTLKCFADLEH